MGRVLAAAGAAVAVLAGALPAHGYFQERIANESHAAFAGPVGVRGVAALTGRRGGAARGRLSLLGVTVDTSPIRLVASDAECESARFPEDFAPAGPALGVAADGTVAGEWEHERGAAIARHARSLGVVSGEGAAAALVACAPARTYAADPAPDERSVLLTSSARLGGDGPLLLAAASSGPGQPAAAAVVARLEPATAYAVAPSERPCDELPAGTAIGTATLHEFTTDAQGAAFLTSPDWGPALSPATRSIIVAGGPGAGPHVQLCVPAEQAWARERR